MGQALGMLLLTMPGGGGIPGGGIPGGGGGMPGGGP